MSSCRYWQKRGELEEWRHGKTEEGQTKVETEEGRWFIYECLFLLDLGELILHLTWLSG